MNHSNLHQTVFLNETINLLNIKPEGTYVDCTFGRGGHSALIINQLAAHGTLVCIDRDLSAITYGKQLFADHKNIHFVHGNFSAVDQLLASLSITAVDGFVFDLGVSSPQFDNLERGFSYHGEHALDMRMDQTQTKSAFNVINEYPIEALTLMFKKYGECKHAFAIAKAIVAARQTTPIKATNELVEIIKNNIPKHLLYAQKHPARTYFQALRIEVNDEFKAIELALVKALLLLKHKARMVILTFHSLEDRLVKEILKPFTKSKLPDYIPIPANQNDIEYKFIKAPQMSETELTNNKRARSARMHVIERI